MCPDHWPLLAAQLEMGTEMGMEIERGMGMGTAVWTGMWTHMGMGMVLASAFQLRLPQSA